MQNQIELTILMPCLNEAETLEVCIRKAFSFINENEILGEVVIADNGSTDGSQEISRRCGARVVDVPQRGYGAALIGGTLAAKGKYVIMGDADDSYDFVHLQQYIDKLREGYDLVMGNRFKGGIQKGAMPPLHRYLGNPVLSFLGRLFYSSSIRDFHCGLRGYNRERILALDLQTTGMEYASEMVVQSTLHKYRIAEVATTLAPDGRTRAPHLRSFRDGWRHLKFLLMYSPDWLFMIPGYCLIVLGLLLVSGLSGGLIRIGNVGFDVHTMLYGAAFLIMGVNVVLFAVFTKIYAANTHFIPRTKSIRRWKAFVPETGMIVGVAMILLGFGVSLLALKFWSNVSFGNLESMSLIRIVILAISFLIVGVQVLFGSFFIGILNIKHKA